MPEWFPFPHTPYPSIDCIGMAQIWPRYAQIQKGGLDVPSWYVRVTMLTLGVMLPTREYKPHITLIGRTTPRHRNQGVQYRMEPFRNTKGVRESSP